MANGSNGNENLKSLEDFKSKIRRWESDGCDCKPCRYFVSNLGYVKFDLTVGYSLDC